MSCARRSAGGGARIGAGDAVLIRPEAIRLGDGAEGENRLAGTVVDATFLGNIVDYQIDIGGSLLRVQGDRRAVLEPGARVAPSSGGGRVHGHACYGLRSCVNEH